MQVLIDEGVFVQFDKNIVCVPDGNSDSYQKLDVLASPARQSLERYFMAITVLSGIGSGKLSTEQAVNLCHAVGERLSTLYGEDLPDNFDKALFSSFISTLARTSYVYQKMACYILMSGCEIARFAKFALSADTLRLLQEATKLSDEDIDKITDKQKVNLAENLNNHNLNHQK